MDVDVGCQYQMPVFCLTTSRCMWSHLVSFAKFLLWMCLILMILILILIVFYFELVRAGLICQIPFMDVFDFDEDQIPMVAHKLGTRHALNPCSVTPVSSYYYHSMAIICMNEILLVHSV